MTREDAIKIFNTVLLFGKCDCPKEEIEECFKMAIKALEQEPFINKPGVCEHDKNKVLDKIRAEIEAIATEADFADYNGFSCGEEMSTETARCEAEDISMGVKLDDVRAIFDKYLGEVKDDKSDRNK